MAEFVEGRDYLVENGLVVFTASYLARRGFCCRSGCRNCPYGYRRARPPEEHRATEPGPPRSSADEGGPG